MPPAPPPALRTLWLLRHAKAVADPPPGGTDFDRVLAPRGRRDATALGGRIGRRGKGLGLGRHLPEVALVSAAARTTATAELVCAGMAAPPRLERRRDLYGAEPEEVVALLRALGDEVSTVLVVGHNPTMQALGLGLLSPDDTDGRDVAVRRGFPTCALGIYEFGAAAWRDVGARGARLAGLFIPPFADK
jgi:phosphohistidine phosphatase